MTETKPALASESTHWYAKDGTPMYQVPYADPSKGMRDTKLSDARKLSLLPSVTLIIRCAAAPGLEAWKADQLLDAALTLPRLDGEIADAYKKRVIEDAKAQGLKAREKGTVLHGAIERHIQTKVFEVEEWHQPHVIKVMLGLRQYGIDLWKGHTEHSFASPLGYGGKIDWHNDEVLIDFKTTAEVAKKKQLAWPEHCWQLAAYTEGLNAQRSAKFLMKPPITRCLNVFVGVDDCEVRIHEWPTEDVEKGFQAFKALLRFWQITKEFK